MPEWVQVAAPVAIIVVLTAALLLFLRRLCFSPKPQPQQFLPTRPIDHHHRALQDGIAKLHQTSLRHQLRRDSQRRPGYNAFRRGTPLFNWADHPSLVTDAAENGWSRFAFTAFAQSPSVRSPFLGLCTTGDNGGELEPELSWEVCPGSVDFIQRIRLNPKCGPPATPGTNLTAAAAVIKTALPLPGPPLGDSPFPQAAYFEITVLRSGDDGHVSVTKVKEGEKTKLIDQNLGSGRLVNGGPVDEVRGEPVALSVGFTAGGGSLPLKLPGSYPGSIGFNSTGSVYLDGIKLVFESESTDLDKPNKVIGCGFDPKDKKVFFTVDSELKHLIQCKSEVFGGPLYPTIAANSDITVLVNFGQTPFIYAPANANRTSNSSFIGPVVGDPTALGYEDSRELFSMGRIDAQWLNSLMNRGSSVHNNNYNGSGNDNSNGRKDFDEESDADLFEIVLDSSGRSPVLVVPNNNTGYSPRTPV